MDNQDLTIGQRVRIIIDAPGGVPIEGTIKVIQDKPGKMIGVELDRFTEYAHSLDKLVDERTDPIKGISLGKGWWSLAQNLEIIL